MMKKLNPKALNLDDIKSSTTKVTLGFKCTPDLKIKLAEEARTNGLTLSNYVESLLLSLENSNDTRDDILIKELSETNELLLKKIDFYQNSILRDLFKRHKNETVSYKTINGEEKTIKIMELQDVYTVVINSFK